ncbi:MAG: hypothetical protein MK357_05400 [SAR202 cluster bacterium]|nr:hypothetical protein [SAR202 cluster bacterium]
MGLFQKISEAFSSLDFGTLFSLKILLDTNTFSVNGIAVGVLTRITDVGLEIGTDVGLEIGTDVGLEIGTDVGLEIGSVHPIIRTKTKYLKNINLLTFITNLF